MANHRVVALFIAVSTQLCLASPAMNPVRAEKLLREKRSEDDIQSLRNLVGQMARQSILHQLHLEESVRAGGDSGLKQLRHVREGTKAYHSDNHIGWASASNHDHANNIRTIGMGEVVAVLNGVEFRTRHNDYALRQAHLTDNTYQATSDLPFPSVPWYVNQETTIEGQAAMMRNFFQAWRDQNPKQYNYTRFMKPVLCYLEGMWTIPEEELDESFESDRHYIDANSWYELEEKIRFLSYTGSKDPDENLAYLPRIIINVTADGYPVYAQWNYDILCHPLAKDLPLDRFRYVDDLSARMRYKNGQDKYRDHKLARFTLNTKDEPFTSDSNNRHSLLDSLMYEIPGKDNYNQYLEDRGLGDELYMHVEDNTIPLNSAYYHRAYVTANADAMGSQQRYRGFSDRLLYFAQNTQEKIAGMSFTSCDDDGTNCHTVTQKWSYAIPLEIIYLTPLSTWNPYNLQYKGDYWSDPDFKTVNADGRNGQPGKAYNGTNGKNFYQTPIEFYNTVEEVDPDPADTTPPGAVSVLDPEGVERLVVASGHRIFFPEIPGVGILRQRFPIAPVHAEGNPAMKEVEALKELVMNPNTLKYMIYDPVECQCEAGDGNSGSVTEPPTFNYRTTASDALYGNHVHQFTLSDSEASALSSGENVTVTTSQANGHTHTLLLYAMDGSMTSLMYASCDSQTECWDGHQQDIIKED